MSYPILQGFGISYKNSGYTRSLIRTSAEVLNPCGGFNYTWEQLVNIIYYLVKEGHFAMSDLERSDWYFVSLLYDTLREEIEQEAKRREEENRKQEQEMANYQQMQDYQSKMMDNMNYNQNMPSIPSF